MRVKDVSALRGLLEIAPAVADREELLGAIARSGCILKGHFALQQGSHSAHFVRFRDFAARREDADVAARLLLDGFGGRSALSKSEKGIVVCPESAGFLLGAALARALDWPILVAKIDAKRRPTRAIRRGAVPQRGQLAIVANDVVTSGSSIEPMIRLVEDAGARLAGVLCLALRSAERLQSSVPKNAHVGWLFRPTWATYASSECPLCRDGVALLPSLELN